MRKIWTKLALILIGVMISGILISTAFSIQQVSHHFSLYVGDVTVKHSKELGEALADAYASYGGWSEQTLHLAESMAKVLEVHIELYDKDKKHIATFDDFEHNMELGEGNHHYYYRQPLLLIESDGQVIGYVNVQNYESETTRTLEKHFQEAHTSAMLSAMGLLIVFGVLVSIYLARLVVRPIDQIRQASVVAAKGDLTVQVPVPKRQDELVELVRSFNQLIYTLKQQEDLKKRLTSDIAHELRTPINTILAQIEGMIDGIWDANEEHLESTRHEVLRLSRLVQDLDQVVRTESGTAKMNKVPMDLSAVAREVAAAMRPSFYRDGIELACELQRDAVIIGDPQRIAQVITNLLGNSLKFTAGSGQGLAQGSVHLTVRREETSVVLTVQDTGSGIPEEDLPFVFDRFYRGDRSRQRETGGSGLGLTIVKSFVEAHGGTVAIESTLGRGTTVTVRFPAGEVGAS
ncbi:sensor histidine kinase [Brevibacillus dissolubilis]|uniref:sensor histidine kinase n=1 Tax=Brevibacillus dissolubilis TaxID=1844116 RepID=UPI001115E578|nr:ATP-binding protein [Brevibacillus dissolubilis]